MASIFHVSGPNSSISNPCLTRMCLKFFSLADSNGEKWTVSGMSSGWEAVIPVVSEPESNADISFSNAMRSCAACGLSVTIPASVSISRYPESVQARTLKNFQGPEEDESCEL